MGHLLSHIVQAVLQLQDLPEGGNYTFASPISQGALGMNSFSHPWTFQVGYLLPPPALGPLVLSKFLAECITCQFRLLILVTPCWMETLGFHSFQHVRRLSLLFSPHKKSYHGCVSRLGVQGSAIGAFNPLAAQRCVLYREGFSPSVCQAVAGTT